MKLKIYNADNAASTGKSSKPTLSFSKNGLISFNKAAVLKHGLKEGMKVEIAEDEENDGDWYFKVGSENGFILRSYKGGEDGRLNFNSSKIVTYITEPLGLEKANIPIAPEPTEEGWYALLTVSLNK